jgi:hypothetical protein
MADNLANAFRSERLIYRAVRPAEDITWSEENIQRDPAVLALVETANLRPEGGARAKATIESVDKSLLAVVICLPADEEDENEVVNGDGKAAKVRASGQIMPSLPEPKSN